MHLDSFRFEPSEVPRPKYQPFPSGMSQGCLRKRLVSEAFTEYVEAILWAELILCSHYSQFYSTCVTKHWDRNRLRVILEFQEIVTDPIRGAATVGRLYLRSTFLMWSGYIASGTLWRSLAKGDWFCMLHNDRPLPAWCWMDRMEATFWLHLVTDNSWVPTSAMAESFSVSHTMWRPRIFKSFDRPMVFSAELHPYPMTQEALERLERPFG